MAKLDALWTQEQHQFEAAYLTSRRIKTNIQMFKDKGTKEPWFIATSAPPSIKTAGQYAKRWGIEVMFSDFKSRGFGISESQLRVTPRIHRLMMVHTTPLLRI